MPQDTRIRPPVRLPVHLPHVTLNTDGQRHPLENGLTVFTIAAGLAALVLGIIVKTHLAATVIGIVAFLVGAYAQLISATRAERIFIVCGMVGAFVGLGMGIAHGGLSV